MYATCLSSMAFLVTSREASGAAAFVAWVSEQRTTRDILSTSRRNGDGGYYRLSVSTKQARLRSSLLAERVGAVDFRSAAGRKRGAKDAGCDQCEGRGGEQARVPG